MSQSQLNYTYKDLNTVNGKMNYYRIKLIDIDGKSSYTEVKSIFSRESISEPDIFPNPSNGSVSVVVKSFEKFIVYIYDNSGREIKRIESVYDKIDRIGGLKPGFYTIKFINTQSSNQSFRRLIVN